MTTNAEKNASKLGKYTIDDWVRIAIAAFIGISGGQAINVASQPNERIAVLETEMKSVKTTLPKMDDKLGALDNKIDSLLVMVVRLQK